MRRVYGLAMVAALVAAPAVVGAQEPAARSEQAVRGERPARLGPLLELRERLGLTPEQVTRLESIHADLQQQNAPLVEQLRASGAWQRGAGEARAKRGERGARGEGMRRGDARRQIPEELRPVMQQLRQNNREAMQQAREVLTDEQQAELRESMREWRSEGQRRHGSRGQRGTQNR